MSMTVRVNNRHYRLGNGSNFEIFEYELDGRNEQQPLNSDIGGFHLAFYVDDLDEAVDYLKSRGVKVLGSRPSAVARTRANGGCTSWHRGGCNSNGELPGR